MHDAIQKVIATEAEAKQRVQTAKAEAERISLAAQKRAREMTENARQETQRDAQEILSSALKQAENDKQVRLVAVSVEIEKQVFLDDATRQRAAAAVVHCVCS